MTVVRKVDPRLLEAAYHGEVARNMPLPKVPSASGTVALPRERIMTVAVFVLGINQEHEPDVFVTQVTCSESEYYEESSHLGIAEERAREAGFVEPFFSFDEQERRVVDKLRMLFGAGA